LESFSSPNTSTSTSGVKQVDAPTDSIQSLRFTKYESVAVNSELKVLREAQHFWSVNFNTFQSWPLHFLV